MADIDYDGDDFGDFFDERAPSVQRDREAAAGASGQAPAGDTAATTDPTPAPSPDPPGPRKVTCATCGEAHEKSRYTATQFKKGNGVAVCKRCKAGPPGAAAAAAAPERAVGRRVLVLRRPDLASRFATLGYRQSLVQNAMGAVHRLKQDPELKVLLTIETSSIVIVGVESAGKSSLIEKHLDGFAITPVAERIGSRRVLVILALPAPAGTADTFELVEEVAGGEKRVTRPRNREEVAEAIMAVNNKGVSKLRMYLTIHSPQFTAPRRIVDTPGFRAMDPPDMAGCKEIIKDTLREEAMNPHTIIVCLTPVDVGPSANGFGDMLQALASERPDIYDRCVSVLTKSDKALEHTFSFSSPDAFYANLAEYESSMGGVRPYMFGFNFEPLTDTSDPERRMAQHKTAKGRERAGIEKLMQKFPPRNDDENTFWSRVGFDNVNSVIIDSALAMDSPKLAALQQMIRGITSTLEAELSDVQRRWKELSPRATQRAIVELVETVKTDWVSLISRKPGYGSQILGSADELREKHGMNAVDEEREFAKYRQQRWPIERMAEASSTGSGSGPIDYTRANDFQGKDFDTFYEEEVVDNAEEFFESVPSANVLLIGGAATERAERTFYQIAFKFMCPTETDRYKLQNLVGRDPELYHYENSFLRCKRLTDIYGAKLRPVALYFVQKMCFLMERAFDCAIDVQLMNKQRKALLESLVGDVPLLMMRGLRQVLLRHGHHAYASSISDHSLVVQQYGSFQRGGALRAAVSVLEPDSGCEDEVAEQLQDADAAFVKAVVTKVEGPLNDYPAVLGGIDEGLELVKDATFHSALPSTAAIFVDAMIENDVLTEDDKSAEVIKAHQPLTAFDPKSGVARLLGISAVLFSHALPQFLSAVIARNMAGLLLSPDVAQHASEYREAMTNAVLEGCANDASVQAMRDALKRKGRELLEKVKKLRRASEELQKALVGAKDDVGGSESDSDDDFFARKPARRGK